MDNRKINYLARTFNDYKSELIKFSNKYYPELADSYNDSSVGSWFIDLVAAVGDNLSFHIDRMYNETSIDSAKLRKTISNFAKNNGVKIPGPKASMCEIQLSCILPVNSDPNNGGSLSSPYWGYAPVIKKSTIVSAGNVNFQLTEDVDFGEQFNSEGYSNRTFVPARGSNGIITGYTVTKTTLAINGSTRVYKKLITSDELKPFMEVILPERDVMNIESIIFKETSNFQIDPDVSEYYIESEKYKTNSQAAYTYRFFEVDSLADQYRFSADANIDLETKLIKDRFMPEMYVDYTETEGTETASGSSKTTRYYQGSWKPITQKFITEKTDNGYTKIIFGAGNVYKQQPDSTSNFTKRKLSELINNDMLGVLPQEGWSMFILYRVGGGISSNLGIGAVNSISLTVSEFRQNISDDNSAAIRGKIINSLKVTNTTPAVAGKDAPSNDEIKYLVKYNNSAQERCVTVKDYKTRLMMMPPKFGAPFRAAVIEENNKIAMSLLGLDLNGKLTKALPETLVDNIENYMSHYRTIGDYIEIKSGKIYNIGFMIKLYIRKSYDAPTVLKNVINVVTEYMNVNNHDIGENIFLGDLQKEITLTDGVVSIIDFSVYAIYDGAYSSDRCPFKEAGTNLSCDTSVGSETFSVNSEDGTTAFKIDLESIDNVLYSDYNGMFEVKSPNSDIQLSFKQI